MQNGALDHIQCAVPRFRSRSMLRRVGKFRNPAFDELFEPDSHSRRRLEHFGVIKWGEGESCRGISDAGDSSDPYPEGPRNERFRNGRHSHRVRTEALEHSNFGRSFISGSGQAAIDSLDEGRAERDRG